MIYYKTIDYEPFYPIVGASISAECLSFPLLSLKFKKHVGPMYVYIYSPDMDIQKYTVTMKIIVNSVKISSPIGTISNSEVVDLQ